MHTNADHPWAFRVRSALASRRPIDPQHEDEALGRVLGIAACEQCGHTILLGEGRHRATLHGRSLLVCRNCEQQLSTHKAARAA